MAERWEIGRKVGGRGCGSLNARSMSMGGG